MTFARRLMVSSMIVACVTLAGCNNVKKELGVGRNSPDEFIVVKRAPLTLPPDYDLRAPGERSAPEASLVTNQAKTIVLGAPAAPTETGSADQLILQKTQATAADPAVREKIAQENGYLAVENKKVVDKLIFWKDQDPKPENIPSSVVNAKEESVRIKKNEADGKPVNNGDVPVIEKKQGTIDKIF